ncbi:MAG: M23 family metallopeptidase [Deltaproteobacteria bacterium]|nr:M23 family metallopeptidase [Deltaproteobacteria bacterium]
MSGGDFLRDISSSKKKRRLLFLVASLLGIGLILAIFFFPSSPEKPQPVKMVQAPPPPKDRVLSGRIAKRDTLFSALCAQNIPADLGQNICSHLKPMVNLRKVKPGDSFEVRLTPEGKFREFTFQTSPIDIYHLALTPDGKWVAAKEEVAVDKYWARVSGEITSSLFEAMDALGELDQLVLDFADIFSWEIDFNTESQAGDRFQMVVERYYVGPNFVKYGRILYAEYQSASRLMQAIYFQIPGGRGDYFTPQGHSLRKDLLRSPLKFTRVSSRYSKSRRHPILGVHRPHLGVDYAAPVGSPVWAVADGTITFCGENEGYGKQIIIKHAKGYKSMYGHLSQFAPGIKKGKAVRQKQVIGYVGSTGLSTGPHLDFRLLKNNAFRNPLREIPPRAASLRPEQMDEFKEATDPVIRWLQDPANPRYRKVATLTSKELENGRKK